MMHSKNSILVICEGEKTEPQIIKKISSLYNRSGFSEHKFDVEICCYKTNIYNFYKKIKEIEETFDIDSVDTMDFLKILINETGTQKDKKILGEKFTSIYLVFDFDFQDNHNDDKDKIKILNEMAFFFNEDSERGLLLLNFPMVESLKHYKLPILRNSNHEEKINDICNYKEFIHTYNNVNITKYSKQDIESLISLNLIRANIVLYNETKYLHFNSSELINLYNLQISNINNMAPIATILFILPIYFGSKFYDTLPNID